MVIRSLSSFANRRPSNSLGRSDGPAETVIWGLGDGGLHAPLKLLAPLKAGHLSMFTVPEAFLEALLTQVRPLAAAAAA